METKDLQTMAQMVMEINHVGVQTDEPNYCFHKHEVIMRLDKMDRHEAVRLLIHVIHVQQLQLAGAKIEYDETNPFEDMVKFEHISENVKCNSPEKAEPITHLKNTDLLDLIERLKANIDFERENNPNECDTLSWGSQEGIIITVVEAEMIVILLTETTN